MTMGLTTTTSTTSITTSTRERGWRRRRQGGRGKGRNCAYFATGDARVLEVLKSVMTEPLPYKRTPVSGGVPGGRWERGVS